MKWHLIIDRKLTLILFCIVVFTAEFCQASQPTSCFQANDTEIKLYISETLEFKFKCICCDQTITEDYLTNLNKTLSDQINVNDGIFALRLISQEKKIMVPLENKNLSPRNHVQKTSRPLFQKCPFFANCLVIYYKLPTAATCIFLDPNKIGRTRLIIAIVWWNVTVLPGNNVKYYLDDESYDKHSASENRLIAGSKNQIVIDELQVHITVIRKPNIYNTAFNFSSAFIAALLALSVGCSVDITVSKIYFRKPRALLLGLFCQYIIVPLISISIYKALRLNYAVGYGMLALASTPGGGLSHIIVFLMKGDEHLSSLLSTINAFLNSGISLLWLYCLSDYYKVQFRPTFIALWLGIVPFIQGIGVFINHMNSSASQAVMTWFTRPLLLLAGILFVTLGVYINNYAFSQINQKLVIGVMCQMLCGFFVGSVSGHISSHQHTGRDVTGSMGIDLCFCNALILIPALRYSLTQPEADIASGACLWAVFCAPLPLLLIYLSHKAQTLLMGVVKSRFKSSRTAAASTGTKRLVSVGADDCDSLTGTGAVVVASGATGSGDQAATTADQSQSGFKEDYF